MSTPNPRTPEEMTPEWLTRALRSRGAIQHAKVTARSLEPIGAGVGLLGQLVRLNLAYDAPEEGAPPSVIAKLPTLDPGGREVCRLFQFYEREITFYDQVAPNCGLRLPAVYFTALDPAHDDYLLLLEDLRSLRMGDEVAGCSEAEAELVVRQIAGFHRQWWDHPRLDSFDWMPAFDGPIQQLAQPAYGQAWAPFVQAFGERQSERMLRMGEALAPRIVQLLSGLAEAPRTIAHGDYRLDNLFFGEGEFAVIDWQIATRARGAFDVGYFLSGCVEPDVRRASEMRLLRLWHETVTGGEGAYTFDDALKDYRLAALTSYIYLVIAVGSLDPANERGMALFAAWMRRRSAAIEDLDADELVPK